MKKFKNLFLTIALLATFLLPISINAAETVEVGNKDALLSEINKGNSVKLTADILNVDEVILINKDITVDLNGKNISFTTKNQFSVVGGNLTLTGNGTVKEEDPYFGAVMLRGSANKEDTNFSTVTVGKDVTLEGWSPVFINQVSTSEHVSYGITVNVYGTLKGVMDSTGDKGHGVYVNGSIQHKENYPVINLKGAKITTPGDGIYAAGYAKWNIEDTEITGEMGLAIKAGIFNVKNSKITGNGEKKDGSYNGNGINNTGVAIAIESNNGYAGDIQITLDGGEYTSVNSHVIYHYLAPKNETDVVESKLTGPVVIKGGTFKGTLEMMMSGELSISGGTFTDKVSSEDLKEGYKVVSNGNVYEVVDANNGEVVVSKPEVKVDEKIDEKVAKEITEASLTDAVTGLKEAIDSKKLDESGEKLITVSVETEVKSYDKEKGTLVLDIKPYYEIDGEKAIIKNELINGKVKVKVAVPNEITFTHAKVVHKNGETVVDTKEYEIKEENGQKYIEIETESFSTFEVSFYTPEKVENPNTVDGILVYTSVTLMSLALLGAAALVLKKKMN